MIWKVEDEVIIMKTIIKKRIYENLYEVDDIPSFDYEKHYFIRRTGESFLREETVYKYNGHIQLITGNKFDTGKEILLLEEVVQSENETVGYSRGIDEEKSSNNYNSLKNELSRLREIESAKIRMLKEERENKQKNNRKVGFWKLFKF